jgi:single-strand DNA-binding protein
MNMARSLNKVQLIGNLTRDPELRYTPQGTAVATLGLATNRQWKTESGETKEEVEFHRLVVWDKLAEICAQMLRKGKRVYVEGRLQTRSWEGKDGQQHTTTEIVISDMILLDSKAQSTQETKPLTENAKTEEGESAEEEPKQVEKEEKEVSELEDVNIDDIPF